MGRKNKNSKELKIILNEFENGMRYYKLILKRGSAKVEITIRIPP